MNNVVDSARAARNGKCQVARSVPTLRGAATTTTTIK
jgi:hypothetical protein